MYNGVVHVSWDKLMCRMQGETFTGTLAEQLVLSRSFLLSLAANVQAENKVMYLLHNSSLQNHCSDQTWTAPLECCSITF